MTRSPPRRKVNASLDTGLKVGVRVSGSSLAGPGQSIQPKFAPLETGTVLVAKPD
jgi:hypothetical protein